MTTATRPDVRIAERAGFCYGVREAIEEHLRTARRLQLEEHHRGREGTVEARSPVQLGGADMGRHLVPVGPRQRGERMLRLGEDQHPLP